jgi:hypothetical protein
MQRAQISPICAACADSDDISKADQIGGYALAGTRTSNAV